MRARRAKRGRPRMVPLSAATPKALLDWHQTRAAPPAHPRLFVSLQPGRPPALAGDAVGEIVAKHAARAGLASDRDTAHVLRHTCATRLGEAGTSATVLGDLRGLMRRVWLWLPAGDGSAILAHPRRL